MTRLDAPCVVCGWSPVKANWRCSACNGYLERTGRDRPQPLLDRQLVRRSA